MAHEGLRQARDRGVTRSKAEKARPPTVPVPQVEIVPGRLTEAEWLALLAVEEGEEVVGDIVADLLARVLDAAFRVYLGQQCVPFTISQAREAMLQITEWLFLARDEGESAVAEDPTWGEDEEPSACTTDSWAQGSVPVLHAPTPGRPAKMQSEDRGKKTPVGRAWMSEGSQERTKTGPRSSRLRVSPGLAPSPEQEAGPEGSLHPGIASSASLSPDIQSSLNLSEDAGSPDPSEQLESVGGDGGTGSPDEAGDPRQGWKAEAPRAHHTARLRPHADGHIGPSSAPTWPQPPRGPAPYAARLDPAEMPSLWVRPLVEVLGPRYEPRPPEALRSSRSLGDKTQDLPPRADLCGSSKILVPFPPGGRFRALPGIPRPQLRPLNLPCSSFEPKIPSPGLRFLDIHQVPKKARNPPSSGVWPRASWPTGWEGAAELLDQMWAGGQHPHVHTKRPHPEGEEAPDVLQSRVLKSTSQVRWTPMLLPGAMTLAPGVSMWNPITRELLTAEGAQLESGPSQAFPSEQHPIQTAAPRPRVTAAQLTRNSAPKVWAVFTKPPSPSKP